MAGVKTTAPPWVSWGWSGTGAAGTGELASSAPVAYLTGTAVDSTTTSRPASATYIHEITTAAGPDFARTTQARQQTTAAAASGSTELLTDSSALSSVYLTSGDALITTVASTAASTATATTATATAAASLTTAAATTTTQSIYDLSNTAAYRLSFTTMMDTGSPLVGTTWLNNTPSAVDVVTDWPPVPDTVARDVVVGILLSSLGLLTVFGNTLVILAIYRERCLRTVTNLFIASLALADFIIGTIVIPFGIYNELRFGQWVFGKPWCDLWHAIDILACTASILNLCVIAVDRYWAITRPMSYPSRMTKKLGMLLIASVWICSSLISFPCIAWWQAVEPSNRPDTDCVFPEDPAYLVFSSCISFYIPSTLMIFMYAQVYRTAVEQVRVIKSGQRKVTSAGPQQGAMSMRVHRGGGAAVNNNHPTTAYTNGYHARNQGATSGAHGGAKSAVNNAKKSLLAGMNREHKAARTLGIVMGVFIICWLPFFIINVMAPLCPHCVVNPHITFPVLTWLGYANSALNPAIYAFTSRKFKRAFAKIICDCLPQRYRPHKWDKRRRPRRTMSMSNVDPDSSYTMVEYGDLACRSPDRKVDSTTAILSGGKPHLYTLKQTYF